jgi:hypothetical protein
MRNRLPLVISIAALVVSVLGSTPLGRAAYDAAVPRNSVGSLQLKRNAVTSSKIAPNAIRGSQVVDGSLLTGDFKAGQIPQGPKGDKGDKGQKGDQGPPGLSALEYPQLQSAVNSNPAKQVEVSCTGGKQVISGGAALLGAFANTIIDTNLIVNGSTWRARGLEVGPNTGNWSLLVRITCAKVAT